MPNFMIINDRNEQYEYTVTNISAALDKYIESVLGFESGFTVSKSFWDNIKNKIENASATDYDKVQLVNGFCRNRRNKIKRVLTEYSTNYPIIVSFDGFSEDSEKHYTVYRNGVEECQDATVHLGDTLEVTLVPDRGYTFSENEIAIKYVKSNTYAANGSFDYKTGLVKIPNITESVLVQAQSSLQKIDGGDWSVTVILGEGMDMSGEAQMKHVTDGSSLTLSGYMYDQDVVVNPKMTAAVYQYGRLIQELQYSSVDGVTIQNITGHLYVLISAREQMDA